MQANKNLNANILKENEGAEACGKSWTLVEIVEIIAKLNKDSLITEADQNNLLNMIREKNSKMKNLTKNSIDEEMLTSLILEMSKDLRNDCLQLQSPLKQHQVVYKQLLNDIFEQSQDESQINSALLSLKFIKKCISNIRENKPHSTTLQFKNFLVKKHILNSPSSKALLLALGFEERLSNDESIDGCLTITDQNLKNLNEGTISIIDRALTDLEKGLSKNRKNHCIGKCGFLGEQKLNGYCEKCYEPYAKVEHEKTMRSFCLENCGFFGSEKTSGLCSTCYKKKSKSTQLKKTPRQKWNSALFRLGLIRWWVSLVKTDQKDISRCWKCNKKIGLIPIRCNCRYYFCSLHRSTLDHDCSFNYKKNFEKKLIKENPLVVSKKIERL